MNICMFAKNLPVHVTGGMEIHIQGLIEGLVKRGCKVTLITAPHPQEVEKEEKESVTIYYLKNRPNYTREKFYKESAELFKRLNHEERFDIIHSQSTLACGYARYCKRTVPLVLTSHGTALNEIKTILCGNRSVRSFLAIPIWLKIHSLDESILFKKAYKIIAVSNELKEDLKKQHKIPDGKLITIPNGIDTDKFRPLDAEDLRKRYNLTDERVILSVGTINKQKGAHLLLEILPEVLKENKNIKLFIVGTGHCLNDLKKAAVKLNISENVVFTGNIPNCELPKYYNIAHIFVMPTPRLEGLPLTLAEAMACEKPVIVSQIGGIPTVVENNKDGVLVEPGDLRELKEKILKVLSSKELAKRLGKNARKKVIERFSLDRMIDETIKVYEEALTF